MKGRIIAIVLIIIIILGISVIAYSLISNKPVIPPDNGNGNGEPSANIFINSPTDHYAVPVSGPWHHVNVEIETKDITGNHKIILTWHGDLDYSKKEWTTMGEEIYNKEMLIQRLGTGSHSLVARLYKDSTIIDEDTIHIENTR
jgi:hypothetical protein